MTTHNIKLRVEFCDAVVSGEKSFEIRRNDRGYQQGDHIIFQAVERDGQQVYPVPHPVNDLEFEITYVLNGYGLENGFVAFGIKCLGGVVDEREYQ